MGQLFCCGKVNNDQLMPSQYLLQINRFLPYNKKLYSKNKKKNIFENFTKNTQENLMSLNYKYNMIYCDINTGQSILMVRKLEPKKTIEGMSELNLNNNLYICGSSSPIPEEKEGSYLFEINPLNPETKILPNSKYSHYYPALIAIQKKYIYCIGGKNQEHCELFDLQENQWAALPNLPEERYLCTLCCDEMNNIVYLFGGINSKNHLQKFKLPIEYDYFLRLKNIINVGFIWEKIEVKNNKILLNRISAASLIFENEENYIYIFGGKDEQENLLDDIIIFSIETLTFQKTEHKLDFPTEFMNQYPIKSNINNFSYVFLDKFNKRIIIDKHDYVEQNIDEIKTE